METIITKTLTETKSNIAITEPLVKEILRLINLGLPKGLGEPGEEGNMCIEAVICYVTGQKELYDHPESCVPDWLADLKIELNDLGMYWKDNNHRAEGLKRLGIAQLGSLHITRKEFFDLFWIKCHQRLLPRIMERQQDPEKLQIFKEKFTLVKTKEEFEKLWEEFKRTEDYYYYYNYYNYNNYNNYYYNYTNYTNNYYYYYYIPLIIELYVECLIDLKSEGSKFLHLVK